MNLLKRWWLGSRRGPLRRHPRLFAALIAVVLGATATIVGGVAAWERPYDSLTDQLTAEAVVAAGGTFYLAVVAGALALVAYAESLRQPDLFVRCSLLFDVPGLRPGDERPPQRHVVATIPTDERAWVLPDAVLYTVVENRGDGTARNVTVNVWVGLAWSRLGNDFPPPWIVNESEDHSEHRLQWEGGTDLAIHPSGRRDLPTCRIRNTWVPTGTAAVEVTAMVIADGSPPRRESFAIPVSLPHDVRMPELRG